jgi:hypothetical protein
VGANNVKELTVESLLLDLLVFVFKDGEDQAECVLQELGVSLWVVKPNYVEQWQ